MFCHLERHHQLEAPSEPKGLGQIGRLESFRRNTERSRVDPFPVYAIDVLDTELPENREPSSRPAPDVYHGFGSRQFRQDWNNRLGRLD